MMMGLRTSIEGGHRVWSINHHDDHSCSCRAYRSDVWYYLLFSAPRSRPAHLGRSLEQSLPPPNARNSFYQAVHIGVRSVYNVYLVEIILYTYFRTYHLICINLLDTTNVSYTTVKSILCIAFLLRHK